MTKKATATLAILSTLLASAASTACGGAGGEGGGAASPTSTSSSAAKTGGDATDFATRDIDGKTFKLSDHLGKETLLIDFWATFCEPCLAEMPHLRRINDMYKSRGFSVVAISMDGPETVADVPSFAKRNGMTFPVLLDEDSRIASIYNPKKSAPFSVLIDKTGKIVNVHEGYNPGDEVQIEQEVVKALDRAVPAK